ncbi:MAG: D-alanyl-D-alanine carboxypeptidase [Lachnospiraceae bacterium]|nr:D-alanyl-D-alanine carboxypeptidase [Lachnospiraceae bacterium]
MLKKSRISAIILSLIIISTFLYSGKVRAAEAWPSDVDTLSSAAIVMDVHTGAILYEKNIDAQYYPASITKILTTLLAIENSNLSDVVTFSHDAVYKNEGDSSHIGRDLGEQMTMEECLYAVMLESANECAYAVAEHVGGGDVNKFIQMMNDRAKELGCTNTHFCNPNGLPDSNHYVSARDMAIISRAAYQNKIFDKITGTKTYTIPPTNKHAEPTLLNNHHAMLNYYQTNKYLYDPCVGGKTGYTNDAGATLVTYAKKNNMTLVSVVLHGDTQTYYTDTTNILEYCFDNFKAYDLSSQSSTGVDNLVGKLGPLNSDSKYIMKGEDSNVILPNSADFANVTAKLVPSQKEDVAAQIQYYYADRFVGSADLVFLKASDVPYPFHNIDEVYGGSGITYFRIDFKLILIVLGIAAIVFAVNRFMRQKSGRILLKKKRRRDGKVRRRPKTKYTTINRNRKKSRRRRR